jgi:gliding motility-associated-like protein
MVLSINADFKIDPSSVPPVFKFNNISSPINPSTWLWHFGQLGYNDTSTFFEPSKDYGNDTGHYNVCLIAKLPFGCKDTFCQVVFNDRLPDFGIFNVFTPGQQNQLNDVYDIIIENETYYNLQIFDRWGKQVYFSDKDYDLNDPRNWNGKLNNTGPDCPSGTYYYIFQYRLAEHPEITKLIVGTIQLIR